LEFELFQIVPILFTRDKNSRVYQIDAQLHYPKKEQEKKEEVEEKKKKVRKNKKRRKKWKKKRKFCIQSLLKNHRKNSVSVLLRSCSQFAMYAIIN